MLKNGADYLAGLRDGRIIYVGGERVDDVTTHPGFRNAARSYAQHIRRTFRSAISGHFELRGKR